MVIAPHSVPDYLEFLFPFLGNFLQLNLFLRIAATGVSILENGCSRNTFRQYDSNITVSQL